MTRDVVVIGAGISGLSTAYELMRRGRDVVVLERQVVIGGNAISERLDGFLMEHGPSTINAVVPAALEVAHELDLAASSVDLGANVRKRYLLDAGNTGGAFGIPTFIPAEPRFFGMQLTARFGD